MAATDHLSVHTHSHPTCLLGFRLKKYYRPDSFVDSGVYKSFVCLLTSFLTFFLTCLLLYLSTSFRIGQFRFHFSQRSSEAAKPGFSFACVHFVLTNEKVQFNTPNVELVTGPPTHSVGGQTSEGGWRLSSVDVVVCNIPQQACRRLHPHRPSDDVMPPAV